MLWGLFWIHFKFMPGIVRLSQTCYQDVAIMHQPLSITMSMVLVEMLWDFLAYDIHTYFKSVERICRILKKAGESVFDMNPCLKWLCRRHKQTAMPFLHFVEPDAKDMTDRKTIFFSEARVGTHFYLCPTIFSRKQQILKNGFQTFFKNKQNQPYFFCEFILLIVFEHQIESNRIEWNWVESSQIKVNKIDSIQIKTITKTIS